MRQLLFWHPIWNRLSSIVSVQKIATATLATTRLSKATLTTTENSATLTTGRLAKATLTTTPD